MLWKMMFRSSFRARHLLALLCVPAVLVACGDDSPATGGSGGSGGAGGGDGGSGNTGGSETGGGVPDGCTEITQKTDGTTLFSIGGVGFVFDPPMGLDGDDVVVVSPQNLGVTATGSSTLNALDSKVISFAVVDAITDLINAEFGDMDGRLFVAVEGRVNIEKAPSYATQFKGRVKATLSDVKYLELDENQDVITDGDCFFLKEGSVDAGDWVADCDAPTDVTTTPSGGTCLDWEEIGHDCNPITNEGCASTQICDWGGYFRCYDKVGDEEPICGECDTVDGPLCQVGMTCDSDGNGGTCYRYCCTNDDCGAGATCIAYSFAPTGVGVCLTDQ